MSCPGCLLQWVLQVFQMYKSKQSIPAEKIHIIFIWLFILKMKPIYHNSEIYVYDNYLAINEPTRQQ